MKKEYASQDSLIQTNSRCGDGAPRRRSALIGGHNSFKLPVDDEEKSLFSSCFGLWFKILEWYNLSSS
jgi:hypothetical protein